MNEERAKHWMTAGFKPRPWWRRVNLTIVALVIAIATVAVIGVGSMSERRNDTPSSAQATAAPRQNLKPRHFVGAFVKRQPRKQRARDRQRPSPPVTVPRKQSPQP